MWKQEKRSVEDTLGPGGDRRWVGWFQGFDYYPWARKHRRLFLFLNERVEQNDGERRPRLERRQTAVAGNDERGINSGNMRLL